MSILDKINRIINEDREYTDKLFELQKVNPEVQSMIYNSLETIKELTGITPRVRSYYLYGYWFMSFVNSIYFPLTGFMIFLTKRHIYELIKKSQNEDSPFVEASYDSVYELLIELNDDNVRNILTLATTDTKAINVLSHAVRIKDYEKFFNSFQDLNVKKSFLKGINFAIMVIGICEKVLTMLEWAESDQEPQDSRFDANCFAAVINKLAPGNEFDSGKEIINRVWEVCNIMKQEIGLLSELNDATIHEIIDAKCNYRSWIKNAQLLLAYSLPIIEEILPFLTDDEINSLNSVININDNIQISGNGESFNPTERVVYVVVRWFNIYYGHSNVDNVDNQGAIESSSEPVGYIHNNVLPVSPKLKYAQMRKISCRLAASPWEGHDDEFKPQKDYIKATDIVKLCRFFMQSVGEPDSLKEIDTSTPLFWNGHWIAFKYFVYRLYGSPKCMPSGLANVIVDSVRFQRQRKGKMAEYGKIALDTYNTGKWIDVSDEDRKLIDDILKGCMPT